MIRARRIGPGPAVHPGLSPAIGSNINGPSLVETPDWAPRRLARYLLYFAAHEGRSIRLAAADRLEGPWRLHAPDVLALADTDFAPVAPAVPQPDWAVAEGVDGLYPHIASPDVAVDDAGRRFTMLLHGLDGDGWQRTARAHSADGLAWRVAPPGRVSDEIYLRRFTLGGRRYAVGLGARILRERADGSYETGPRVAPGRHRHPAPLVRNGVLHLFSHRIGDAPEHIVHMTVDAAGDWRDWRAGPATPLLEPALDWEGAGLPVRPSRLGGLHAPAHELRDPYAVEAEGGVWLAYAAAGESAIGLAAIEGL